MADPATRFATEVYLLARRHLDNFIAGGGAIPKNIAAQLLAEGHIALRGLHDEQRGANIHRRQRLQFLISVRRLPCIGCRPYLKATPAPRMAAPPN